MNPEKNNGRCTALRFSERISRRIEMIAREEERSFRWVVMRCVISGLDSWEEPGVRSGQKKKQHFLQVTETPSCKRD